jgi:NADP-dependent 3-hydroxy acid dehydrogenase YdfG
LLHPLQLNLNNCQIRQLNANIKGVLYGIAASLHHFDLVDRGHFINISSVADRWVGPTSTVYNATNFAVRTIIEGLCQEISEKIRVTLIATGSTESGLANSISHKELKQTAIEKFRAKVLSSSAIAKAIGYAIAQLSDVDVNQIVVRTTSQKW